MHNQLQHADTVCMLENIAQTHCVCAGFDGSAYIIDGAPGKVYNLLSTKVCSQCLLLKQQAVNYDASQHMLKLLQYGRPPVLTCLVSRAVS